MNESSKGCLGQRAIVRDTPFTAGWVGHTFTVTFIQPMPELDTYWYHTPRPDNPELTLVFPEEWLDFPDNI